MANVWRRGSSRYRRCVLLKRMRRVSQFGYFRTLLNIKNVL